MIEQKQRGHGAIQQRYGIRDQRFARGIDYPVDVHTVTQTKTVPGLLGGHGEIPRRNHDGQGSGEKGSDNTKNSKILSGRTVCIDTGSSGEEKKTECTCS